MTKIILTAFTTRYKD